MIDPTQEAKKRTMGASGSLGNSSNNNTQNNGITDTESPLGNTNESAKLRGHPFKKALTGLYNKITGENNQTPGIKANVPDTGFVNPLGEGPVPKAPIDHRTPKLAEPQAPVAATQPSGFTGPIETQPLLTNEGISTTPAPSAADKARREQSLGVLKQGGLLQLSGDNAIPRQQQDTGIGNYQQRASQIDYALQVALNNPQIHRGLVRDLMGARDELDKAQVARESASNTSTGQSSLLAQQKLDIERNSKLGQLALNQDKFEATSGQTALSSILSAKEKGLDLDPSQALGAFKIANPGVKLNDQHLRATLPQEEYLAMSELDAPSFYKYAVGKFGKSAADELLESKYGK